MSSLLVVDTLVVNTQSSGQCFIELCMGDITELNVKDKVDVLFVSIFGSSYSLASHTLVGALSKKLKLSIKDLAEDKEEDLRHAYMCWWSKPLPKKLPYKKVLCFENRGRMCRPQELVGNVFRCLVPILNNEPGTVITPLLNTGGQGQDEVTMLTGMVNSAIKWMKAGLPLKRLKIVLFANVVKGKVITSFSRDAEGTTKAFRELKERHNKERMIPITVPLEYDIYLSHSPEDTEIASLVEAKFLASKPDIRICKTKPILEDDTSEEEKDGTFWQEDLYKIISKCARVVPIISPAFLENKSCIDLYNMALCCNRRAQRDLLAPLYIEYIKDMPTYMGLVQYIDCSPKDEAKIIDGCEHVVQMLEQASMKVHTEMIIADASPLHYDVFVSYSHKDSRLAVPIVEKLQKLNPKLRIFFDIQELKAGTTWQRMLYHAIDGCRSFVALVSNSYMKSAMCIEEFNLALAKHCSSESRLCLIPVCIEPLVDPLPEFQQVRLINATPGVFDPAIEVICTSLVDWIQGGKWHPKLDQIFTRKMRKIIDAPEYALLRRRLKFILSYGKGDEELKRLDVNFPPSLEDVYCPGPTRIREEDEPCDVAFSCAPEDKSFVKCMARILEEVSPGLVVKQTAGTENERLALIESARKVVVFLSANYLESVEQVEEFHTVLLRQRYRSPTQVLFTITIHNLPQLPTYFHLVPCEFHIFDPLWMELYSRYIHMKDLRKMHKVPVNHSLERYEIIGILAATHSLLQQLKYDSEHPPPPKTSQQPMLLNVLLLHSEVKQLHKEVRRAAGDEEAGQDEEDDSTCGDGSPENNLLDVVEECNKVPVDTKVPTEVASPAPAAAVSSPLLSPAPDTSAESQDEPTTADQHREGSAKDSSHSELKTDGSPSLNNSGNTGMQLAVEPQTKDSPDKSVHSEPVEGSHDQSHHETSPRPNPSKSCVVS